MYKETQNIKKESGIQIKHSFHWLFFRIWTRDSFDFELALVFDPSHWGIGITALLPYLRFVCTIPKMDK
jgi:hypothetical protein